MKQVLLRAFAPFALALGLVCLAGCSSSASEPSGSTSQAIDDNAVLTYLPLSDQNNVVFKHIEMFNTHPVMQSACGDGYSLDIAVTVGAVTEASIELKSINVVAHPVGNTSFVAPVQGYVWSNDTGTDNLSVAKILGEGDRDLFFVNKTFAVNQNSALVIEYYAGPSLAQSADKAEGMGASGCIEPSKVILLPGS
jgi:hypothetical protein